MTSVEPRVVDPSPGPGVLDAVALGLAYADRLLLQTVRDTHRAWARRSLGLVPGRGRPVAQASRTMHEGVSAGVYAGIGTALWLAGLGLGHAGRRGVGPRLEDSSGGRATRAVANGLFGDRMTLEHPGLAIEMAVRRHGRDVPLDPEGLAAAFPSATTRVVVFVHGLTEDERIWQRRREGSPDTYAERLETAGWTPVLVRFNTGLSVAENGVALAALLERLVRAWPDGVTRLALVGHSLGGLVAGAACAVRTDADEPWAGRLVDLVTLGTPHLGAPLARLALRGSRLLARLPEAAAFGRVLDHRSRGIVDLERGHPDVEPLAGVRYHLVSASLGPAAGPAAWLLGDLVVDRASAQARHRGTPLFPDADMLHVPRCGHLRILDHPDVADALERWLA
jgi:pimeloyl-ACP methyl ester carboxylesterase